MNCQRIDELLLDALDEPLAPAERAEVDTHLAACPACVENLRTYVTTVGILRDLGRSEESEPVAPLSDTLVRRILDARASVRSAESTRRTG